MELGKLLNASRGPRTRMLEILSQAKNADDVGLQRLSAFKRLKNVRKGYLLVQAFHCLFLLLAIDYKGPWVFLISGLVNSIAIVILFRYELSRSAVYVTPYSVYLFVGVARLGFANIWLGAGLAWEHFELLVFGISSVENVVAGLLILQTGDFLLSLGYFVTDRSVPKERPATFIVSSMYQLEKALTLYGVGWAFKIAIIIAPGSVGTTVLISTFSLAFTLLASLILIEKASTSYSNGGNRIWWIFAITMIVIDVAIGMQSYMKSAAAMAVFPVFIYILTLFREHQLKLNLVTIRNTVFMAVLVGFVGLIVFPFWQMRRASYDIVSGTYSRSVSECLEQSILSAIPGTEDFSTIHEFPLGGAWGLIGRHCNSVAAAWSYEYVQRNGNLKGKMASDALPAMIPRFLWPEKPTYAPARLISVLMGLAQTTETATTATDAGGMAGGLYLDLGWIGLSIGMLFNGIMLASFTRLLEKHVKLDIFAGIGWVVLYASCSSHFESAMDGNITLWGMLTIITVIPFLIFRRSLKAIRV
jgi:hypothetical protein